MATRSICTAKRCFSSVFSRSYSSFTIKSPSSPLTSVSRLRPVAAFADNFGHIAPAAAIARGFATRQTTSSLNDSNPNWSNRPPKETILLDGCDFEHWLVVVEKPEGEMLRDELIDHYIKTLAQVVGSEEEARMKIYSVSTQCYYAFGALVSEELSYKLKEIPHVRWVLPDSYLDVKNKDYGGEPFIDGKAVPYDPKYHEEWRRNNARANERNRRNDRPRNFDRSRNFERRRENTQPQNRMGAPPPGNMGSPPPGNMGSPTPGNMGSPPPGNMGSPPPGNMGSPPPGRGGTPNMGGFPPQSNMGGGFQQQNNMGGPPQNNMGGPPQNNMGGPFQNNMGGPPQNNMGGPPQNNMGGAYVPPGFQPQNNMGGGFAPQNNMRAGFPPQNNMLNNMGVQQSNIGGASNMGQMQNGNFGHTGSPPSREQMSPNNMPNNGGYHYQSGQGHNIDYQNSYPPNTSGENSNRTQDMPGRDMDQQNYQ